MDNQVLGYKDLAALPKDKAILDIERPDLMIYEPHFTYSLLEHVELPRSREVSAGTLPLGQDLGGKVSSRPHWVGGRIPVLPSFLEARLQNKRGNCVQDSPGDNRVVWRAGEAVSEWQRPLEVREEEGLGEGE